MILIQQNDLLMLCIQEYDNGVTEKSLASLPLKLTHWFLHINASSMEWGGDHKTMARKYRSGFNFFLYYQIDKIHMSEGTTEQKRCPPPQKKKGRRVQKQIKTLPACLAKKSTSSEHFQNAP